MSFSCNYAIAMYDLADASIHVTVHIIWYIFTTTSVFEILH